MQSRVEVGRLPVEGVQQELVVGDLGRHPEELRIDGSHRAPASHRHALAGRSDELQHQIGDPVRLFQLQEVPGLGDYGHSLPAGSTRCVQ